MSSIASDFDLHDACRFGDTQTDGLGSLTAERGRRKNKSYFFCGTSSAIDLGGGEDVWISASYVTHHAQDPAVFSP